jgi:hypothetical protein
LLFVVLGFELRARYLLKFYLFHLSGFLPLNIFYPLLVDYKNAEPGSDSTAVVVLWGKKLVLHWALDLKMR